MDHLRSTTRTVLLLAIMSLVLGSSGCSYRGIKHRVLGLAGYGCQTCGAENIMHCACSFDVNCGGYQSTLWGELPTDCWPEGEFAFAKSSDQEEEQVESVLPEEAAPEGEVNPLPEPLDLDPAPAPPSQTPEVTPEGDRERDPAPPLFDPDQSTPNPFPLREGKGDVTPPSVPDLFDEGDKPKTEDDSESPNPFPLRPKADQLKEEIPDLFQKNSNPSGSSEANVVRFGRVLHAAPPASSPLNFQKGSPRAHQQPTSQATGLQEEGQTTLRLGRVLAQ